MTDARPLSEIQFWDETTRNGMKSDTIIFCSILFVASLFVADVTTVKLIDYSVGGVNFIAPAGTLAFALTFLATDVICEITGSRVLANKVVFMSLFLRVLAFEYYHLVIGSGDGKFLFFGVPAFWTQEKQDHFNFILGGTARIALAGLISASVSFLLDTYVFTRLRAAYLNRNLYWFRNGASTTIAQVVNSTVFISLAFGDRLSVNQIALTAVGQILLKTCFAWLDTPFALILRNYGQGRRHWFAFWRRDFYVG